MKKISCIIIEDERIAREGLKNYIAQYAFLDLISTFSNAEDALIFIEQESVDLIFLDIEMPGMKGIEMAKRIEHFFPLIIFTTAYPQYALDSYQSNTIGYLVKPIFPNDFDLMMKKVQQFFTHISTDNSNKHLIIKNNGELLRIDIETIRYLKSLQNYVMIYLNDGKHLMILTTMKEMSKLLPKFFFQTHRSYLVNLKLAEKISDKFISIGHEEIPIGRSRYNDLKHAFKLFHGS